MGTNESPEREALELVKLREEIAMLRQPFRRNPTTLLTILSIGVAVFGVAAQYFASMRKKELADIQLAKAELQIDSLNIARRLADSTTVAARESATVFTKRRDLVQEQLVHVTEALNQAEQHAGSREGATALAALRTSVDSLSSSLNRGLAAGTPVEARVHLPYKATLKWWHVQSPGLVNTVQANADTGWKVIPLDHGGTIYFEAIQPSGETAPKSVDCRQGCSVQF